MRKTGLAKLRTNPLALVTEVEDLKIVKICQQLTYAIERGVNYRLVKMIRSTVYISRFENRDISVDEHAPKYDLEIVQLLLGLQVTNLYISRIFMIM